MAGLAAFCALVWYVGPLISIGKWTPLEPELNRIVAILIVVALWGAYKLFIRVRNKRRGQKLVADLSAPATGEDREAVEEAQLEEIASLSGRFEEALRLLGKSNRKGRRNSAFLYEIPWYVIIGGPGSGKTTLLRNSGLKFPLSEQLGDSAVKGVGGTRNCDWFFADQAIFLDTAGRYTTQDSFKPVDKAAWSSFLGLLKKCRPRRPINGVLLAMSMPELMDLDEEGRRKRGRELRLRINELYEVLSNRFPVYLVFTKCDLIAGFNDYFSELTQEDRSQVWGETFPFESSTQQPEKLIPVLESNFDEVLRKLDHWTLQRIQDERDANRRGAIFCFPQQLASLKPVVSAFLRDIFGASRFESEPLLRGVYFTSGTQEGTPIDRIMAVLAGVYGFERQELPAFHGRPRSFFIGRLLKEVIFPEAELAGLDPRIERRRKWFTRGAFALLLVFTAGLLSMWSVSYFNNSRAIAQVRKDVDEYRRIPQKPATPDEAVRMIVNRLDALAAAKRVYSAHPWDMRFGLYQGDKVNAGIEEVYEERLKADLLPAIDQRLEQQMNELLAQGDNADSGRLYQLLRTYLMLAIPERMNIPLASASISFLWERAYPNEPQLQQRIAIHTDALLKVLDKHMPIDGQLVENVRRKLKSVPLGTQLYNQLKSVAIADRTMDFQLVEVVPGLKNVFTTVDGKNLESMTIPGFYTLRGYDAYFEKQGLDLVKRALNEDWVLNQLPGQPGDLTMLYHDMQEQYFAEYAQLWRTLVMNLTIIKPKGVYPTIQILDRLSGPDTPLRPLLQAVEKNTDLFASSAGTNQLGTKAATSPLASQGPPGEMSSGAASKLESDFQPLDLLVLTKGNAPAPLDKLLKRIKDVRDLLMQVTSGANSENEALLFAQERMNGSNAREVIMKAKLEFARLPEPLQGWLNSLVSSSWKITLKTAASGLDNAWRTEVLAYYTASLDGRYPLFANSRVDATLDDFTRFFAPKGIMDQFLEAHLKSFIDTNTWQVTGNQGIAVSALLVRAFEYAAKIRDAFFAPGASTPAVGFQLEPLALDSNAAGFQIEIDGQSAQYTHGSHSTGKFQWPGPQPDQGVTLTFKTGDGKVLSQKAQGPWAWFRVLQKSAVERTRLRDVFLVTFQVAGYTAQYRLLANSVFNPFYMPELHGFRCPRSL